MKQLRILADIVIPWFVQITNDYELIYLDPTVCALTPEKQGLLSSLWNRPKTGSAESFVRETAQFLQETGARTAPNEFLDENGVGSIIKRQRAHQREFSRLINKYGNGSSVDLIHLISAEDFRQQQPEMLKFADKRSTASLIFVDAMFATPSALPRETVMTLNVPPARRYGSQRRLEGVLLDLPPRFTMFGNAVTPLMMDTRVVANWSDSLTMVMSAGWYPSVRVVGMPATNAQGHCYIDVIAVLLRPWPSAAKMFQMNGTEEDRHDVSSLLKRIREGDLKQIDQALLEAQDEAEAQGTPEPRLSFESYTQLLTPVMFVQLLAYLNGVHGTALKLRAPSAYHEIEAFLDDMVPLFAFLDAPSQELILDMGLDMRVEKLLPEPVGWHMGKKVPLVI